MCYISLRALSPFFPLLFMSPNILNMELLILKIYGGRKGSRFTITLFVRGCLKIMSLEDHHCEEDLEEEIEQVSHVPPCIYEGMWDPSMPAGFDAVTLHLDGRVQSELDWKK